MWRRRKVNPNSSGSRHLFSRTGEIEKGSGKEVGLRAINYKGEYLERKTRIPKDAMFFYLPVS